MMTQADLLANNEEMFASNKNTMTQASASYEKNANQETVTLENSSKNKLHKPTNFETNFPDLNSLNLTEHSPIRPSKYLASDSAINASKGLRNIIIGGLIFSFLVTVALMVQIIVGTTQVPARIGIVTQEEVCSNIGGDMVRKGGNSIDAFIASALCLSVVNPFASGLGAGGFLLIRDHKHEKNVAYNCFFKSPQNLIINQYTQSPTGKRSIGVPGELKCLQKVYHKYARFYWKTLAEPAIKLARDGFKVSKLLVDHLKQLDFQNEIKADPIMSEMFIQNDVLVNEGSIIKNLRLAKTLELLINKEKIFYLDGEIGIATVEDLTNTETSKQQLTMIDLKNYNVQEEEPISADYNDFVMLTTPSPSSGPIFKFIIDLLQTLKFTINDLKSSKFYSKILEASKMAYIMASEIGDPQYSTNQLKFSEMLTLAQSYFNGQNTTFPFSQTDIKLTDDLVNNFISVNDHNDLMVSYVGTLGSAWGSRIITQNGFFMNNALNLFVYDAQSQQTGNTIGSSKQPRGLLAPILTYNQKNPCIRRFAISYGHHGSMANDDFAITEIAQVIVKLFTDFSLYENSISDKRVQYASVNGYCAEAGFDSNIINELNSGTDLFKSSNSCSFHSIDLIMKKDHVVYGQADTTRSQDSILIFN